MWEINAINALVGIIFGIATLYGMFSSAGKKLWRKTLGRRGAQLDRIEHELTSNGGKSLKDIVIETKNITEETRAMNMAFLATREEAIFLTDAEGEYTWTSPAFQRLVGRSSAELLGRGWVNIFPQRVREQIENAWFTDAVGHERNFEHCTTITNGPNGQEMHAHATAVKMRDTKGNVTGYFGTIKVYDDIE